MAGGVLLPAIFAQLNLPEEFADMYCAMPIPPVGTPDEVDVRFLGYRLDVIRRWPPSARKTATAEAVSRRLTAVAQSALERSDVEDLLNLSCRLLDEYFEPGDSHANDSPSADNTSSALPGMPPVL